MKIKKTNDPLNKPSVVMCVYGDGGVGKSTFASTAPKPLMLDFENGSKYFGLRGINIDVVNISRWEDVRDPELIKLIKGKDYETIIVDPIGEAMLKLKSWVIANADKKYVQSGGDLTMAGWGYLKEQMRFFMKFLRDSGKHIIFVAHVTQEEDEGRILKHPMIETKIYQELINLVDIVGYMFVTVRDGKEERLIMVQPNDKYAAKDRTDLLGRYLQPNFREIVKKLHGVQKTLPEDAEIEPTDEETTPDEEIVETTSEVVPTSENTPKNGTLQGKKDEIRKNLTTKKNG